MEKIKIIIPKNTPNKLPYMVFRKAFICMPPFTINGLSLIAGADDVSPSILKPIAETLPLNWEALIMMA